MASVISSRWWPARCPGYGHSRAGSRRVSGATTARPGRACGFLQVVAARIQRAAQASRSAAVGRAVRHVVVLVAAFALADARAAPPAAGAGALRLCAGRAR